MACKTSYELQHDFPKLAEEAGFTFNMHKPKVVVDWNKIRLLDLDSVIKDKKFVLIENYANHILDCALDSEFDVRILDEGFVKMFRLAQLTVEYQQFCRHYLDRSVFVLRDELKSVLQTLNTLKKEVREKDDEIRKLKRKSKCQFRQPMLYGNNNIADIIIRALTNKGELGNSTIFADSGLKYEKCSYCDKVFLNQLYLKSHITRRHGEHAEVPERDLSDGNIVNTKKCDEKNVESELSMLKLKLKEMEQKINDNKIKDKDDPISLKVTEPETEKIKEYQDNSTNATTFLPDLAESIKIDSKNTNDLIDKIEEWKIEEHDKINKEISGLKEQIIEALKNFKENKIISDEITNNKLMKALNETIERQGQQISELRQELTKHRETDESRGKYLKLECELSSWSDKIKEQNFEYKKLFESFQRVTQEAQQARVLAENENRRATLLQEELQTHLKKPLIQPSFKEDKQINVTQQSDKNNIDRNTLEELHRKAQALLNGKISSSSEDISSVKEVPIPAQRKLKQKNVGRTNITHILSLDQIEDRQKIEADNLFHKQASKKTNTIKKQTFTQNIKSKEQLNIQIPTSPAKIIRAKLAEEVNNKLASAGLDPMKIKLNYSTFTQHKGLLEKQQQQKTKVLPLYERVRNKILANLDAKTADVSIKKQSNNRIQSLVTKIKNKTKAASNSKSSSQPKVKTYNNTNSNRSPKKASNFDKSFIYHDNRTKDQNANKNNGVLDQEGSNSNSSSEEQLSSLDYVRQDDKDNAKQESIERLIKSPTRKPEVMMEVYSSNNLKDSSNIKEALQKNNRSEEHIFIEPKGVLKSSQSVSSMTKKKVIFDMDAIQMKSVSASPSLSLSERNENEKHELNLVNLDDDEEWDISSIEPEPLTDTKTHKIPESNKISELKERIEAQLGRRSTPSSAVLVGAVDVLSGPRGRTSSIGDSNTSLGSSLLDDSKESSLPDETKNKTNKNNIDDIDLSDFLNELTNKKEDSF